MPVYAKKRMPGTWRVVVWSGNRSHEKLVTGSKEEAETYEARWRLELRARGSGERRVAPTFLDYSLGEYRLYAELEFTEGWFKKQNYILAELANYFGGFKLDQIRTEDIQAYAKMRLDAGLRRASVNNELRKLGAVLNHARAAGYATIEVKQIRNKEKRRAKAWTREQVGSLIGECNKVANSGEGDFTMSNMVRFLVNTGCRKGEALAARWDWVDMDRMLLTIQPNPAWKPKSGKAREVPISSGLREALMSAGRRGTEWIFPSGNGKPYRYWPQLQFDTVRKAAGLTGGPHTLRHTFASLFLQKQPDLGLLAQILGHSTTRVTELYTHFLPGHLERARGAVDV